MKLPPWLGHLLRFAFGALVVWALVHTGALKPALIGAAIAKHPTLYGLAFFLYLVPLQTLAWLRWHLLLRAAKVNITARESARLHLTGIFFNGFLPGGTGGDLVKGWYLLKGRSKPEAAAALGTLVVDRITGLFGLIALAAAANWISRDIWASSPLLGAQSAFILAVAGGVLVATALFLSPWSAHLLPALWPKRRKPPTVRETTDMLEHGNTGRGFIAEFVLALGALRKTPGLFVGAIGISATVHFILVTIYALCAAALDVDLPFRLHAYVAPTLTFANGIPLSPAGLGVGEAAGMVLYKAVGASHGFAEIPALVHTIGIFIALLCAPAYLLRKR